jgi:two-component system CheB/CheR fusion protein
MVDLQPVQLVVGIGASAGGLQALQQLVGSLAPDGAVAYLVAQHLAPDHPSLIVDLLERATPLPVRTAVDGARLEPGVIVVAPPNRDLTVEADVLRLADPQPRLAPSPCIDLLFSSIAEQWGERGVAVVLSGTGSDGARGLLAVRAGGGLTLVQTPESARFDGMPRAAIALGGADLVLEPAAIGERLANRLAASTTLVAPEGRPPSAIPLGPVLEALHQASGIDFSLYKESTLRRQIRRRMVIRQVADLDDYRQLLARDPQETLALGRNLLVTFTAFFRDPPSFEALARQLADRLVPERGPTCLRVWVPGCATGEEAYSIAMVVSAVLGHPADLETRLRLFATDLEEGSLAIARRATYPAAAAAAIPSELRQRFVNEGPDGFVIAKVLRRCLVFARHNVAVDPPFPDLDLISCRNTLIYFQPAMHGRVLDLFRFALRPGGLLLLGRSEVLSADTAGFARLAENAYLYVRIPDKPTPVPGLGAPLKRTPPPRRAATPLVPARSAEGAADQQRVLLEALVRSLFPPSLVLDEQHELLQVIGDVTPFCRVPEGRATAAAAAYLRPGLRQEALTLLLMVRAEGRAVGGRSLGLEGLEGQLHLEVRPLAVGERALLLLSFVREGPAPEGSAGTGLEQPAGFMASEGIVEGAFAGEIERLERELLASQENLRRSLADLEQVNGDLEATTEELQASSEELQASNEELETSNEQLRSSNEELQRLNQELHSHGEALQRLNTELENIQASLSQGMVIVDGDLHISRYSPLAVRVFGLVESDLGQPLDGVPTTVPLPQLPDALRAVLAGEPRREFEATSGELAYLVQVMPYLQRDGRRCGVIITFVDVSELVGMRRVAEASLAEFATLTDALAEGVWKRDRSMERVLFVSQPMEALTGWRSSELCNQPGLLDGLVHPEDRQRLAAGRDPHQEGWLLEYRLISRDGRCHWVRESARVLEGDGEQFVVGTLADITALRELEAQASDQAAAMEALHDSGLVGLALVAPEGRITLTNGPFRGVVGLVEPDPTSPPDQSWEQQLPVGAAPLAALLRRALESGEPLGERHLPLTNQQGVEQLVSLEIRPLGRQRGTALVVLLVQERGSSVPQSRSQ